MLKALTACPLKVGEQINVDEPPKKAIAVVPSSALLALDKETSSIVKASPYVLSDDGFDLATFVSKVEPLIEADKDQAAHGHPEEEGCGTAKYGQEFAP